MIHPVLFEDSFGVVIMAGSYGVGVGVGVGVRMLVSASVRQRWRQMKITRTMLGRD